MSRIAIETLERQVHAAYHSDPFHAFRKNVESVQPEEWDIRPAGWSTDVFGTRPELDICDMVLHVGGAKVMYTDRIFGPAALDWSDIQTPARDMPSVLAWLDEAQAAFVAGFATLHDDAQLAEKRPAPWHTPMRRDALISIVTNHDLYHSGEINRQRALIRGSQGWAR